MRKLSMQNSDTAGVEPGQTGIDDTGFNHDNDLSSAASESTQGHTSMAKKSASKSLLILALIAIVAGVATGYGGSRLTASEGSSAGLGESSEPIQKVAGDSVKKGDVFGSQNTDSFKDTAEGYLEEGGIDGEGSHSLLRPGGETQTVYLTSSVTDLDKLVGMEVKVWGETFKGQKAGWLMDVGRIEVVDTKGTPPTEK